MCKFKSNWSEQLVSLSTSAVLQILNKLTDHVPQGFLSFLCFFVFFVNIGWQDIKNCLLEKQRVKINV